MLKFLELPFILLISSAILFPAYSSASSSTSYNDNSHQSKSHGLYSFFTNFFNDPKQLNNELNDFMSTWNRQDFKDINWETEDAVSSLDIWRKWFCY